MTEAERRIRAEQRLGALKRRARINCGLQWSAAGVALVSISSLLFRVPATASVLTCLSCFVATLALTAGTTGTARLLCKIALLVVVIALLLSMRTLGAEVIAGFKGFRY